MSSQSKRLFIAIELPEDVKGFLKGLVDRGMKSVRWVPKENRHLTLRFLGNIGEDVEDKLIQSLRKIEITSFVLPLLGLGVFPPRGLPKVIWMGVGKGHPNLYQLRQRLDDRLLQLGIECDLREFKPHITLGRCQGLSVESAKHYFKLRGPGEGPSFNVNAFTLFESRLSPEGPTHIPVERFRLKERLGRNI